VEEEEESAYFDDRLLTSAVLFLLEGGEKDAARMLARCSLRLLYDGWIGGFRAELTGPRAAYDILADDNPTRRAIFNALEAVSRTPIHVFSAHAQLVEEAPASRAELLELVDGRDVDNQAVEAVQAIISNNMRYRSQSEVRIAQALDRAGVLFLPNCKARLGSMEDRRNREADFLVCYDGKWGILEVDGEPFHPASRTAEDHERDRLFHAHGILVIQHFDATQCFQDPDGVVKRFLDILKKSP